MNHKLLSDWSNAIMTIPAVQFADGIMGVWFDFYMNLCLNMYYWPTYVAGKEDEWSQMLTGSNLCKPQSTHNL